MLIRDKTCASLCAFLSRVHAIAVQSLPSSGTNLCQLLTEIAIGSRALLLEHFKRFVVNGPGGLLVTKDMTQYANLLKSWDIEDQVKGPSGMLDVLLEVGSLFVIGPEALRERISGPNSSASGRSGTNPGAASWQRPGRTEVGLGSQDVKGYVSRREDSSTPAMQQMLIR